MYLPLRSSSDPMTKEEEVLKRHLLDLADMAWQRNIITFSDFLNLNEQNIYHNTRKEFCFVQSKTFGGYESAERQMVAFIPDALSYTAENAVSEWTDDTAGEGAYTCGSLPGNYNFPLRCLKICPLNIKFSEELSHRDYLGSLMNLGVDRSKLGDILIQDGSAYLFCEEKMADYLRTELTRVRHTTVNAQICDCADLHYEPKLQEITGSVASVRLDALLSLAFHTSRSSLIGLIEGGKTFVNGRLVTSNGCRLKEGDLVSVRGYGRFRYCGVSASSRKGRSFVKLEKYV